jgi:hypothetical protein
MMHPHPPSHLPLAVPGIGFPQTISVGPDVPDFTAFQDRSDDPFVVPTQLIDRVAWLPSPRPWFAARWSRASKP